MNMIFLKIVNMSIMASWLILAVILIRLLLKKAPRWITCALWALVAVRLLLPFSFESALSIIPSSETIPSNIEIMNEPRIDSGITVINEAVNPVIRETLTPDPVSSANPLQIYIPLLSVVWIAGMTAMIIYALLSFIKLKRSVGVAIPIGDNVLACDEVESPFILGVFKPAIYVPSSITGDNLDYVIQHEKAHLQRYDHWWKPLGFLLLAVYWFNPLCWVAYILLCRDIEISCDEKVIRNMDRDNLAAYSQALLDCSFSRKRIAACPLAFGEVGVKERVKKVLNYKRPAFWIIIAAIIVCIGVAVCFLTNPKNDGQDLSFLNYDNIIPVVAEKPTITTVYCPPAKSSDSDNGISHGYVYGNELAKFLDLCKWEEKAYKEDSSLYPSSIEFQIGEDFRIVLYGKSNTATVFSHGEIRVYKTKRGDYDKAVDLFHEGFPEESKAFTATITSVTDSGVLVRPASGSDELRSADSIVIPAGKFDKDYIPQVGDKLEIIYDGYIYETYPASLGKIEKISLIAGPNTGNGSTSDNVGFSGKNYVWEKEGFGGDFTITLYEDGTFQYYVGPLSSHIGIGIWSEKNSVLSLTEETGADYCYLFTFEMKEDRIIFKADESNKFLNVTVEDGDSFLLKDSRDEEVIGSYG